MAIATLNASPFGGRFLSFFQKAYKMITAEQAKQERLIERLEGLCGTLHSMPYHLIDTIDLEKIVGTLDTYRTEANGWKQSADEWNRLADERLERMTQAEIRVNQLTSH